MSDIGRRNLRALLLAVLLNSVFCRLTVFGNVFVLFLDKLGLDKGRIGVVLSLVPFAGIVAIAAGPYVDRLGVKRAYVAFFTVRKAVIALLLLTPIVLRNAGPQWAFWWVVASVLGFGLCRAIGEIGAYALFQEVIPNDIRGRFSAAMFVAGTSAGFIATLGAGSYLAQGSDLTRYLTVIGFGTAVGFVSVLCLARVRGGDPPTDAPRSSTHREEMRHALADRTYLRFLGGYSLVSLALSMLLFVPLYLKERVGLSPGAILWLDGASALGGLASSCAWGHSADARGGRRVMVGSLAVLAAMCPCVLALPALHSLRGPAAIACAVALGCGMTGWLIGSDRFLLAESVPADRRSGYISLFYSTAGLANGAGPIAAGALLHAFARIGGPGHGALISPYTPLLTCVLLLTSAAVWVLPKRRLRGDLTR